MALQLTTSAYQAANIGTVSIQGLATADSINILCQQGTISTVNINTAVVGATQTVVYNGINIKCGRGRERGERGVKMMAYSPW